MAKSSKYNRIMGFVKKICQSGIAFRFSILPNARQPLQIPTYDGSGQVVHPSVIDFLNEYGMDAWAGYRYWMALTPYPQSQDRYENPSLYASHDGFTWVVPQDISNPLDQAPGGWEKGFLNDPEMIYNPDTDQLWLYYRFANVDALKILLIKINRDSTLTRPVTIMEQSPWNQKDNRHRSFSLWRESRDRWHMWGGGGEEQQPYNTYYFFSTDGISWGEPHRVSNEDGSDPFQAKGLSNWHMSARPNGKEKRVEFLVYATVISPDFFSNTCPIVYAECPMDSPTLFRTPLSSPVLLPKKRGWDSGHLYRSSFQIVDKGSRYFYRIWYSAQGSDGQWHIGYTEGYMKTFHTKTAP
jgi:hypothetical protein